MEYYNRDFNLNRQQKNKRRFKLLVVAILVAVLAIVIALIIDIWRQHKQSAPQVGQASITVNRSALKEFGSDFFTFTAPESWQEIKEESTPSKYVYRSFRGSLVEQELVIYVNDNNPELGATRLLPVRIERQSQLVLGEVSDHCGKKTNTKNIVMVVIEQAQMLCRSDDTNYIIVVSERGGTTTLKLKHNQELASYSFKYRSSTFTPDHSQLIDILNSFSSL